MHHRTAWILATALPMLLAATLIASAEPGKEHAHKAAASLRCDQNPQACLDGMIAKMRARGFTGFETAKTEQGTWKVVRVHEGSGAAKAGIEVGDVLVALNGVALNEANKEALKKAKESLAVGKTVDYTIARDGAKQKVAVTLGDVPETVLAQWVGSHMLDQHAHLTLAAK